MQDTPLGATKKSEFSCKFNRGEQNSPILAINHWIDKFPPPVGANKKILDRAYIVKRARQCEKERGLHASLIATDFYDLGGVVGAARALNGLGYEPPAKTRYRPARARTTTPEGPTI